MLSVDLLMAILGIGLLVIVWVTFNVWIVRDARARGSSHPFLWAACATLGGILYYVFWWRRRHDRDYPHLDESTTPKSSLSPASAGSLSVPSLHRPTQSRR